MLRGRALRLHIPTPLKQSPPVSAPRDEELGRRFVVALLLGTWVPFVFFVASGHSDRTGALATGFRDLLIFIGIAHVPATLFFYFDDDFRAHRTAHRGRYVVIPALLVVAMGLLFASTAPSIQNHLLVAFFVWQAYHYGRQNVGVHAFVCRAAQRVAPAWEARAIDAATWCALPGTLKIMSMGLGADLAHLSDVFDGLYRAGFVAFAAVTAIAVVAHLRNLRDSTPASTASFLTCVLFFLPLYLSTRYDVAFYSYAIGHGVQYLVFMAVVAASAGPERGARRVSGRGLTTLAGLVVFVGLVFANVGQLRTVPLIASNLLWSKVVDFLVGATVGGVMAHFVVDADAWRLSREPQRRYMARPFGFLLRRPVAAGVAID